MAKNIIVTDEFGNEYETTYLRRAKGLVKNGRARWTHDSQTKICLTCSPLYEVEDFIMENNIEEKNSGNIENNQSVQLNMEYILNRINQVILDTEHIHGAFKALNNIPPTQPNDHAAQAKADAIAKVVSSRENTNQQVIRLLEKMYDDIKPKESDEEIKKLKEVSEILKQINADEYSSEALSILKQSVTSIFMKNK